MSKPRPKKVDNLIDKVRICIQTGKYRETVHACLRKKERAIYLPEILHVLSTGRHEKIKDHFDEVFNAWNYSIRGWTLDGLDLRVIVSFDDESDLLIITVFYLEKRR